MATLDLKNAGPRQVRMNFEWQGPSDAPVVLVVGGISANRHVGASAAFPEPGWWPDMVGSGHALDTDQFRILGVDWLGADGTMDTAIDTADQADAIATVLTQLGVDRIALFIGCSYGAMVGLQFAARHPSRLKRLLAISGADRPHPYSTAWRGVQRDVVKLGRKEGGSREALSLARQLGRLSHGTPEEFDEKFGLPVTVVDGEVRVGAESYLDSLGASYVARTPLVAFLRLSESMDLHNVAPEAITTPTVLVAIDEDRLVPAHSIMEMGHRMPTLERLHLISSTAGHYAYLNDTSAIGEIVRDALANSGPASAAAA